jgi:hypothetical protein
MNFITFARVGYKVNAVLHFIRRLMEEAGLLNYLDETDLYCLHAVFFSLMEKSVAMHQESWNLHKHRMLRYKSPNFVFNAALGDLKAQSIRIKKKYTELLQVGLIA